MKNVKKQTVYLAGQWNEYENDWKEIFKKIKSFDFFDPEIDSNQDRDKFFEDDLTAIKKSNIMVANPGIAPSEATWAEIGYFYSLNTNKIGNPCKKLIIIWKKERPTWSLDFIKKMGIIVDSVEKAIEELNKIKK